MAATLAPRLKLAAVDTNIVLHLAEDHAPSHNLILRLVQSGFTPIVTQTVIQELGVAAQEGSARLQPIAVRALTSLREWGIQPAALKPVGNGICDIAANVIASRCLLPEEERNDAFILIESAFHGASMLVTWDGHLLGADNDRLNDVLRSFDLPPVQVVNPQTILA